MKKIIAIMLLTASLAAAGSGYYYVVDSRGYVLAGPFKWWGDCWDAKEMLWNQGFMGTSCKQG